MGNGQKIAQTYAAAEMQAGSIVSEVAPPIGAALMPNAMLVSVFSKLWWLRPDVPRAPRVLHQAGRLAWAEGLQGNGDEPLRRNAPILEAIDRDAVARVPRSFPLRIG
jgi:hypothetical protein